MDFIQIKNMAIENSDKIESLLAGAGIRISPVRVLILKALMASERPLSSQDIETKLETVDRSSISRALSVFSDSHLVHVISDGSGSMKYEICRDSDSDYGHADEHAHFHCRNCGETVCLPATSVPIPVLPEGFHAESTTYVIAGLCPKCAVNK